MQSSDLFLEQSLDIEIEFLFQVFVKYNKALFDCIWDSIIELLGFHSWSYDKQLILFFHFS